VFRSSSNEIECGGIIDVVEVQFSNEEAIALVEGAVAMVDSEGAAALVEAAALAASRESSTPCCQGLSSSGATLR
jgi:hypothetical protein